jgi:hypothetical protein
MLAKGSTQIVKRAGCFSGAAVAPPAFADFACLRAHDHRGQRTQEFLRLRTLRIVAPAVDIGRVDRAHVHRQARLFESHRDKDAPLGCFARFAADPARRHRRRGPYHQHGLGRIDLRLDLVVELLPRRDFRIPPDRPALRLDCRHQRCHARLVAAGVGNENISHTCQTSDWN